MTDQELDQRLRNDRSWVLSTFSLVRLWWVAIGPVVVRLLSRYNLQCGLTLWNCHITLKVGEELYLDVSSNKDPNKPLFYLRVWRSRFFVRAQPVWIKPLGRLVLSKTHQ